MDAKRTKKLQVKFLKLWEQSLEAMPVFVTVPTLVMEARQFDDFWSFSGCVVGGSGMARKLNGSPILLIMVLLSLQEPLHGSLPTTTTATSAITTPSPWSLLSSVVANSLCESSSASSSSSSSDTL
ncbi:hypothetical protein INR49_016914 [Caranx melampygus]|nr:hypothetical protein INR49_016914 [Caranx melampygus]